VRILSSGPFSRTPRTFRCAAGCKSPTGRPQNRSGIAQYQRTGPRPLWAAWPRRNDTTSPAVINPPAAAMRRHHSPTGVMPAGASPARSTNFHGGVAQTVRALACHARGRGCETRHSRHGHGDEVVESTACRAEVSRCESGRARHFALEL
jgi:hypothetical protein